MEKLEALPSVARISENVVRVLGQNPGKFTLQGTNTYLIGKQNPYILIDTGEGKEEYVTVLEAAFRETAISTNPDEPYLSDIVISHWHHDHVGGIPEVLLLARRLWNEGKSSAPYKPPRLHKFPIPADAPGGHHITEYNTLPKVLEALPKELYTPAPDGSHFHDLFESQLLNSSTIARILHTPGHTVDSISIHIPEDKALYTADTVLGQGTAVFEDLSAYILSLNKMLRYGESDESPDGGYITVYPAHGPVLKNGKEVISTYIKHRLEREAQVLQVLSTNAPADEAVGTTSEPQWSTWLVVKNLYASYPESLWLPAARGIDLHLRKLESDGLVERVSGDGVNAKWKLLHRVSTPSL
ncbi:Metallo-hydrolase/oxidoreductase [Crucibulum laeve]|uniref:Metallo-hydrolase/oxidoreductase n=1 Tax=Crucibulum laeve TaxID=68775 RepID=A0A5C3LS59_9AGAR|nr:Metallo-hydrolase/oxidoreductase [Crucibulum laeve]